MNIVPHSQKTSALRLTSEMRDFVLAATIAIALFAFHGSAVGQTLTRGPQPAVADRTHSASNPSGLLRELNSSLVNLTKEVTPAVVQIMVTSYGPIEANGHTGDVALFARQHAIGPGVILDPEGYIITNAHVVASAQRIRVTLSPPASPASERPVSDPRMLEARLVGADNDTDLALLKVDAHNVPVLSLAASRPVYTGEMVLAVGSPEGLQSSVTMGVVSSVERQPDPGAPAV